METPMCIRCGNENHGHAVWPARRGFLKLVGGAAVGVATSGLGFAAPPKAPPKAENVLSPDGALERLMQGNTRYVDGVARRHDFKHEREVLTRGQNPFAGVLSCADSRVAPEYAFDAGRGDLFVCRVAGNLLNNDVIASFEYAVSVLNTPLILVLGHQACGAVDAAIKSVKSGETLPGHLPSLVAALAPAVKAALDRPGDSLDNTIRQNVVMTVAGVKAATPILSKAIDDGKVRVAGGVYDLTTGKVALVG
jgi:carbonic anhydrase